MSEKLNIFLKKYIKIVGNVFCPNNNFTVNTTKSGSSLTIPLYCEFKSDSLNISAVEFFSGSQHNISLYPNPKNWRPFIENMDNDTNVPFSNDVSILININ